MVGPRILNQLQWERMLNRFSVFFLLISFGQKVIFRFILPVCRKWICIFSSVCLCGVPEEFFARNYTRKWLSGLFVCSFVLRFTCSPFLHVTLQDVFFSNGSNYVDDENYKKKTSFSRTPMRNFLWCYYRWLITSLAHKKDVKKNAIFLKLFWHKVIVHWKLKLLDFLIDSVLNS